MDNNITLYDLGKGIMSNAPVLTNEEMKEKENLINEFFEKINSEYYMLLCKEISYYTIFKKETLLFSELNHLGIGVTECLKAIGDILNIEVTANNDAIEIWLRTPDNNNLCMFLFDCAPMVVTFGGYKKYDE